MIEKLVTCIESARKTIEGLSWSGEYYVDFLKARYDHPHFIHQTHVRMMLQHIGKEVYVTLYVSTCVPWTMNLFHNFDLNTMFKWQKHVENKETPSAAARLYLFMPPLESLCQLMSYPQMVLHKFSFIVLPLLPWSDSNLVSSPLYQSMRIWCNWAPVSIYHQLLRPPGLMFIVQSVTCDLPLLLVLNLSLQTLGKGWFLPLNGCFHSGLLAIGPPRSPVIFETVFGWVLACLGLHTTPFLFPVMTCYWETEESLFPNIQ